MGVCDAEQTKNSRYQVGTNSVKVKIDEEQSVRKFLSKRRLTQRIKPQPCSRRDGRVHRG